MRLNLKTDEPRPPHKLSDLKKSIGKTIERIEWGMEDNPPSIHEAESMILHFTDGTSMGIIIGSNVVNILGEGTASNPCPITTDLMVTWIKN